MTRMIEFAKPNFLYTSFEVRTKSEIPYKMANYGIPTIGSHTVDNVRSNFNGIVDRKHEYVYLFHAEKQRKKTKVVQIVGKNPKRKNGANTEKFETQFVRHGHWKVRVFRFKLDRVHAAQQLTRTFKVKVS